MTKTEIKNFQNDVRKAYSNLNIDEFAKRLGREIKFENGKPTDMWICEMWERFQNLSASLGNFDPKTLSKILYESEEN